MTNGREGQGGGTTGRGQTQLAISHNFSQFLTIFSNFTYHFLQFLTIQNFTILNKIFKKRTNFPSRKNGQKICGQSPQTKNGQKMLVRILSVEKISPLFQKDGFLPSFFFLFRFVFKRDFHFIFCLFPLMLFQFIFPSFPYPQKKSLDFWSKDPRFFYPFSLMPSRLKNRALYSSSWPIRPRSEQLFSNTIQNTIQICQQFCPNVASKNVLTLPAILSQNLFWTEGLKTLPAILSSRYQQKCPKNQPFLIILTTPYFFSFSSSSAVIFLAYSIYISSISSIV